MDQKNTSINSEVRREEEPQNVIKFEIFIDSLKSLSPSKYS